MVTRALQYTRMKSISRFNVFAFILNYLFFSISTYILHQIYTWNFINIHRVITVWCTAWKVPSWGPTVPVRLHSSRGRCLHTRTSAYCVCCILRDRCHAGLHQCGFAACFCYSRIHHLWHSSRTYDQHSQITID